MRYTNPSLLFYELLPFFKFSLNVSPGEYLLRIISCILLPRPPTAREFLFSLPLACLFVAGKRLSFCMKRLQWIGNDLKIMPIDLDTNWFKSTSRGEICCVPHYLFSYYITIVTLQMCTFSSLNFLLVSCLDLERT